MIYGNIVQLMPAQPGWEVVYCEVSSKAKGGYHTIPLTGWALVEVKSANSDQYGTTVVGMIVSVINSPALDFVDSISGFLGYNYPGCNVNWQLESERYKKIKGS